MGVHSCKCKAKFFRKFRMCMLWDDHARDKPLYYPSRPWLAQAYPITPVTSWKREGKFVQWWSRPPSRPENSFSDGHALHHARDPQMNTLSRLLQERKARKIDPGEVTPIHHARDHGFNHHHAHEKGRDHLQELFSFFLFFPCSIMPMTNSSKHDHARD